MPGAAAFILLPWVESIWGDANQREPQTWGNSRRIEYKILIKALLSLDFSITHQSSTLSINHAECCVQLKVLLWCFPIDCQEYSSQQLVLLFQPSPSRCGEVSGKIAGLKSCNFIFFSQSSLLLCGKCWENRESNSGTEFQSGTWEWVVSMNCTFHPLYKNTTREAKRRSEIMPRLSEKPG